MASDGMQRRIERLLDPIDDAESQADWESVKALAQDALGIDPDTPKRKRIPSRLKPR